MTGNIMKDSCPNSYSNPESRVKKKKWQSKQDLDTMTLDYEETAPRESKCKCF